MIGCHHGISLQCESIERPVRVYIHTLANDMPVHQEAYGYTLFNMVPFVQPLYSYAFLCHSALHRNYRNLQENFILQTVNFIRRIIRNECSDLLHTPRRNMKC
jgi:hypothetical protein